MKNFDEWMGGKSKIQKAAALINALKIIARKDKSANLP